MLKHKVYLRAVDILKYLMENEMLTTLITTNPDNLELITSDQSLYEALGSIKKRDKININLLVKLLEIVTIVSFSYNLGLKRKALSHERAQELRTLASVEVSKTLRTDAT